MKRPSTPLTTPGLAAHLTWKQFDLMLLLNDGPLNVDGLAALLKEVHEDDVSASERIFYWGVSPQAVYSTLVRLEQRGLVTRQNPEERVWALTTPGRRVIKQYA